MGIIALSAAAVLVFQFGRPVGEALSLSLALMCTMILVHLLIGRAQDRSAVGEAVDRLEDRMADLDDDFGNLEGRLTGVEHTIPRRTRAEIDPLFAEVEVLGTLVKQMAEAMSELEGRVEDQEALPRPSSTPVLPHYTSAPPSLSHAQAYQPAPPDQNPDDRAYAREQAPAYQEPPRPPQSASDAHGYLPSARDWRPPQHEPGPRGNDAPYGSTLVEPPRPSDRPEHTAIKTDEPRAETAKPDPAMRELILAALNANRVELHLQPIVSLPQRQVKYYEAFTRLRDAEGGTISAAAFLPEAVRGGLIARIDNLLLFRSIQVMRRLLSRNRNAALFCNISSLSLVDETFFPGFLEFVNANRNFTDTLIFEFSQADVADMGMMELESLSALSEIGFSFSIDRIHDLKMDFKSLSQRGFKYAKLHADYLIGRRTADHGHIHPSDFGDLLHRYGMQLITDHVETESQVLELLDFEVTMAQGNLFSPPRPVRAEVLQGAPAPAAPRKRAVG